MAHTPQKQTSGERRVGWPKRLILTSDLSDYPRPLIDYADFIVNYSGAVIKNRNGHAGYSATGVERSSCKTLGADEAKILIDEAAWRGQQPAVGTRRRIILDAIQKGDVLSDAEALEIADSVESALLRSGTSADDVDSHRAFAEQQQRCHHDLRESDPKYAEYHRGAELAYALVLERLGGESAAVTTGQAHPEGSPERSGEEAPDGWQGEPPAEGTRRKLILDTIREHDGDSDEGQLELADAIELALIDDCDVPTPSRRQLRTVLLPPIEEHDYRLYDGHGGKLAPANAVDLANEIERAMRSGGAAELPAEETRRRVIFAVLSRMYQDKTLGPLTPEKIVDAIEAALRDADEITDVDRLNAIAEERWQRIGELESDVEAKQAALEGLAATVSAQADVLERRKDVELTRIVIPYGRDNAWVTELAYQAAGAATRPLLEDHPDYVFPAERVQEAVAYLLETYFGIPRACGGCQEEHLEHGRQEAATALTADDSPGGDDPAATIKFLEGEVERLLGGREEARTHEARFAEERDCAFALLRWLLPVTVAKRVD